MLPTLNLTFTTPQLSWGINVITIHTNKIIKIHFKIAGLCTTISLTPHTRKTAKAIMATIVPSVEIIIPPIPCVIDNIPNTSFLYFFFLTSCYRLHYHDTLSIYFFKYALFYQLSICFSSLSILSILIYLFLQISCFFVIFANHISYCILLHVFFYYIINEIPLHLVHYLYKNHRGGSIYGHKKDKAYDRS